MIELLKDKLGGRIKKEFVALRLNMYSYQTDDGQIEKKTKAKKCVIKQELKLEYYKNSLEKN